MHVIKFKSLLNFLRKCLVGAREGCETKNTASKLQLKTLKKTSDVSSAMLWTVLVYALPFTLSVIFAPFWTHLGKNIGHKKMLIRSTLVLSLTQFFMFRINSLLSIVLIREFQGAFAGFTASAQAWNVSANLCKRSNAYICDGSFWILGDSLGRP